MKEYELRLRMKMTNAKSIAGWKPVLPEGWIDGIPFTVRGIWLSCSGINM